MRVRTATVGALLVAGGLAAGFWLGRRTTPAGRPAGLAGERGPPPSWEDFRAGLERLRGLWDSGARGRPEAAGDHGRHEDRRDGGGRARRSRAESFQAFREALAAGDRWAARGALHDLGQAGGEGSLGAEEIRELGDLLASTDRELVRDVARALAVAGGGEGLSAVLGFLEDPDQPLERRRQALEGLSDLPPERAPEAIAALADFLGRGPPSDLERTAANAIGRLSGKGAVETLLGLLGSHPAIRAEAVFDAVGDLGGAGDSKSLLALLGGDFSPGAKLSLLRSSARLAARGSDASGLLDLLRSPPAGLSREAVARALGDASRDLGSGILRDALRETAGDRQAQEAIAHALVWQGGKEGLEALLEAADDPELKIDQRVLARALNGYPGGAAVPLMLDLFRSASDESILEPLARGLAQNANRETMESLLGLLESAPSGGPGGVSAGGGDAWQRRALARALEDGSSAALSPDRLLTLLHGEKDQEVASSLARAMSRLYPSALEGRATDLFQSATSPVERIAFAQVLERNSAPGTAEVLGRQLRGETDSKAQWEMARILGRFGEEGVAQIAAALQNVPDERQRHSVLWGLEASRRPVAAEARSLFVEMAAGDPSPSIRAQAAEILGRQQDPALIPVLKDLLGAEDHRDVRERVERAIRELEGRR